MGRKLVAAALVALMAVGSITLWVGVPLGWLYLGSRLDESSRPTLGPYVLVLVGIPVTMALVVKGLAAIERAHATVTHTRPRARVQPAWQRSLRGGRGSGHPATVLDVVMVWSVGAALASLAVWFFAFAGSSLPG